MAIAQWLAAHATSPMTRERLAGGKVLVPNVTLRKVVEDWCAAHPAHPAAVAAAETAAAARLQQRLAHPHKPRAGAHGSEAAVVTQGLRRRSSSGFWAGLVRGNTAVRARPALFKDDSLCRGGLPSAKQQPPEPAAVAARPAIPAAGAEPIRRPGLWRRRRGRGSAQIAPAPGRDVAVGPVAAAMGPAAACNIL